MIIAILFVYGVPILVLLFIHLFYIGLGDVIAKRISNKSIKVLFWNFYIIFGILVIYSNLIWNVEEASIADEKGRYDQYNKYYSSPDNKYKKVTISGIIDPQLNVEFSVPLVNNYRECSDIYTSSSPTIGNNSRISENVNYPLLKSGTYSIDVYLENYNKDTNCLFINNDYINIYIYGNGRKERISYGTIRSEKDNNRYINHQNSEIVCYDIKNRSTVNSTCDYENNTASEAYMHGHNTSLVLNFTTKGVVSGNTYHTQKPKRNIEVILNTISKKFFVFELPTISSAPSYRSRCTDEAFITAIYKHDSKLVKEIIKDRDLYFLDENFINVKTCSGTYASSIYAARGDYEMFMHLLQNGAQTNMKDQNIFISAFKGNNQRIIKHLIDNRISDKVEKRKAIKAALQYKHNPLSDYLLHTEVNKNKNSTKK